MVWLRFLRTRRRHMAMCDVARHADVALDGDRARSEILANMKPYKLENRALDVLAGSTR